MKKEKKMFYLPLHPDPFRSKRINVVSEVVPNNEWILKKDTPGYDAQNAKIGLVGTAGNDKYSSGNKKKSLSSYVKYVEIEVICNYTKLFVVFTNQKFLAIDTAERF